MNKDRFFSNAPGWRLFALSFTALFLELMVIRWVPTRIRLVAYYANLMLISSFLGLGIGVMLTSRRWRLFRLFAPLFLVDALLLILIAWPMLPGQSGEWRFDLTPQTGIAQFALIITFVLNAIMFVPLGEQIGILFNELPPLLAYTWDLGGSLMGTVTFALFSLLHFSPVIGMGFVALLVLACSTAKQRLWSLPCYVIAIVAIAFSARPLEYWSPYYYITVDESYAKPDDPSGAQVGRWHLTDRPLDSDPPADLRTMQDPPIYSIHVNQDAYQRHASLDLGRYPAQSWKHPYILSMDALYGLPHHLVKHNDRVLVLGAGGGMDVEAALMNGASQVHAVEIDPVIARLSARFNARNPYADPKVALHVDDARAFLGRDDDSFDLVIFGFLDSQTLFSYGTSLRLDGYTYTVESFKRAFARVHDGGAMVVSFYTPREFIAQRIVQMLERATGRAPRTYYKEYAMVIAVGKGELQHLPADFFGWQPGTISTAKVDLPTDDWPYLYLERPGIPRDYALVIGCLLAISLASLVILHRGSRGRGEPTDPDISRRFGFDQLHFMFLGWGFLLLQTKSIGDCSLYFGATWLVSSIVICGTLLMILLANLVAMRLPGHGVWMYLLLFAAVVIQALVPRELLLSQPLAGRLAWSLLVVPAPIFFAGLIFSTTFRRSRIPAASLSANLIGATIGGFCEYLSMWIGSDALRYIVIAVYAASMACMMIPVLVQTRLTETVKT